MRLHKIIGAILATQVALYALSQAPATISHERVLELMCGVLGNPSLQSGMDDLARAAGLTRAYVSRNNDIYLPYASLGYGTFIAKELSRRRELEFNTTMQVFPDAQTAIETMRRYGQVMDVRSLGGGGTGFKVVFPPLSRSNADPTRWTSYTSYIDVKLYDVSTYMTATFTRTSAVPRPGFCL